MRKLIERLEKATGPDRGLDEAIHVLVTGKPTKTHCEHCGTHSVWFPKDYTSSIDAAVTLLPDEWKFVLWTENGMVEAYPIRGVNRPAGINFRVQGHDLPIATCIAALKARQLTTE